MDAKKRKVMEGRGHRKEEGGRKKGRIYTRDKGVFLKICRG